MHAPEVEQQRHAARHPKGHLKGRHETNNVKPRVLYWLAADLRVGDDLLSKQRTEKHYQCREQVFQQGLPRPLSHRDQECKSTKASFLLSN